MLMDNWSLKNFRSDLSKFLDLISKYSIGDFSQLYDLLGKIDSLDTIEYELSNVAFYIDKRIAGTIPIELNKYQIFFENTLIVEKVFDPTKDFLKIYKFELNIDSYISTENGNGKCYKNCWHLDKHIDSSEPKYTHPTYHFHFGGEYINSLNTGDISIFSNPRLPHPPMDFFLGFHFIISNFYSSKEYPFVKELKGNYDYQMIIKRAQKRLWEPYFKAFDLTNTHQDFTINKIFPLYLN